MVAEKFLKDYQQPLYTVTKTDLWFELGESVSVVKSALNIKRVGDHNEPLVLNGTNMRLLEVAINNEDLMHDAYEQTDSSLILREVPAEFILKTIVEINPVANKSLTGLYKSNMVYCTQCESHGFRNITYHLDRPDILSIFTVTLTADLDECPILLSNGNKIDEGKLPAGRHWVKWHDPHPKPTYLFAVVAGKLDVITDNFITKSGRAVTLEIYITPGKSQRALFALNCLKKAMKWDEERFHREYDLDVYMIVAVNDFNFGAMENKGLNIFNDKFILAAGDCASDQDFMGVDVVVAHEYFHNWSGNRITCRDWFQLSLKEGLTVFREQKYTEDEVSCAELERISQAKIIEQFQFKEDAGPMSHPIRPSSYIDMNNFYTVTVYNKGAEVIRMLETMSSSSDFIRATDIYFEKFDGQAVTTDDFIDVMQDELRIDLSQFRLWYDQAGTPEVYVKLNKQDKNYSIIFTQKHYPTHSQKIKSNMVIPIRFNLFNENGEKIKIPELDEYYRSDSYIYILSSGVEELNFQSEEDNLIVSALEGFSAPVILHDELKLYQRLLLAQNTSDGYQKFKQMQKCHIECIEHWLVSKDEAKFSNLSDLVVDAHEKILLDPKVPAELKPAILSLPSEAFIMSIKKEIDIDKLISALKHFRSQLSERLFDVYQKVYAATDVNIPYHYSASESGKRSLRNYCLKMINITENEVAINLASKQYSISDNMTDKIAALDALAQNRGVEFEEVSKDFYKAWEKEPLVIDKWLALQALSQNNALEIVKKLQEHESYDSSNPNRVRALIGTFSQMNFSEFHKANGEAYEFLTQQVIKIQAYNSQLAARLVSPLLYWRDYDASRQSIIKACLKQISECSNIAVGVLEPVNKALQD